jgi:VWFA-related protein
MQNRCAVAIVVGLLCALRSDGQGAQPPDGQPAFRVQIDAVEVHAFVTDTEGRPVTDLAAGDFELLEDGRRQAITSFARVDIPVTPTGAATSGTWASLESDVQHNDAEGRVYAIAFDNVPPLQALRTRQFLRRFIENHIGDSDRAAIVSLSPNRITDAQDFTNSRRFLLNALDRFTGGSEDLDTPSAAIADAQEGDRSPSSTPVNLEAITRARLAMSAFRQLTEFMATISSRRKTILFISTGIPIDPFNVIDNDTGVLPIAGEQAREAVRAAMRGNVAIYTIDPRGLTIEGGSGEAAAAPTAARRQSIYDGRDTLRALAEVTGGFALTNSNAFDAAFDRIVRENSSYYVLGYQSTNERRDGRYRRVRVQVNRSGVQVRARDGYLALTNRSRPFERPRLAAGVSPAVSEALANPLGAASLPMRLFAAPYKTKGRDAAVAVVVEIDAAAVALPSANGTFNGQLEVVYAATNAEGRLFPGDRHYVQLALERHTYDRARRGGFRVLLRPQLPPGRYQLRVAAGLAGRAGSVLADLEIPDFSRQPLMLSGVAMTSAAASDALTVRVGEAIVPAMPAPIVATRAFTAGETITIYTEVYENLVNPSVHTLELSVDLRSDVGGVVSTTSEQRRSTDAADSPDRHTFRNQVPLNGVPPGQYILHVEARSNAAEQITVTRDIPIHVR